MSLHHYLHIKYTCIQKKLLNMPVLHIFNNIFAEISFGLTQEIIYMETVA